jgi:exodeoxyribonuclease V gamma subunit
MLHLHFSNRLPALIDRFIALRAADEQDVFATERVIVPNHAVRRAMQWAVTDREGISANLEFDHLARWIWRLVGRVVPAVGRESPFRPESLTWHVLAVLQDRSFVAAHPRLLDYLTCADPVMRHALAVRIAGLFDQYTTYRSEWLSAWAAGNDDVPALSGAAAADRDWQAALWRACLARLGATDRHPLEEFVIALGAGKAAEHLPDALHVMALPSIPVPYLELLKSLSAYTQVHLYALNPCQEYWADIISERRYRRLDAEGRAAGYDVAHTLLAAWGGAQQAYFAELVERCADAQDDATPLYDIPSDATRLGRLQRSMLMLQTPEPGAWATDDDDRSLEVHVCHSLTRQLEVALDRLLGLFEAHAKTDRPLHPHEVLIAVPDIETAAPIVEAVFSALPDDLRIPYTLTGRRESAAESVSRAFLTLLSLAGSRLEAGALHGFLLLPLVRRRFGLDEDALDTLRDWIRASGYRYGFDTAHHERLGLPTDSRVTLEDGLDRLFLSYILPCDEWDPVLGDRLPAQGVRDPDGDLLARYDRFAQQLAAFMQATAHPLSGEAWSKVLLAALDDFFQPTHEGDELEELAVLRSAIRTLCSLIEQGDADGRHPLGVIRASLEETLDAPGRGGVPSGAVTVASLSALRGLSYRVLFVLGLDDGVFPRADRPVDFDLIAKTPQSGDRQRRTDDRHVFLDHLVATTEVLHLSYTGFNDRTNAPLPPSVLISELLDVLVPAVRRPDETVAQARARVVVTHPLQPFSPACFDRDDPRRQSHQAGFARALRKRAADPLAAETPAAFFDAPLAPTALPATLPIHTLAGFYRAPAKALLQQALGLRFERDEAAIATVEPLVPETEAQRRIERHLLEAALLGADAAQLQAYTRALPDLPSGILGEVASQTLITEAIALAQVVHRLRQDAPLPPLSHRVAVRVDDVTVELTADWADLRPSGVVCFSPSRRSASALIETWVLHLMLNLARPAGVEPVSRQLFRDGLWRYEPVADPEVHLANLLRHYREGLSAPLHFYPKTSLAKAEGGSADTTWEGTEYGPTGEAKEDMIALAVRGVPTPLDGAFARLSEELLGPLVAHLHEEAFDA